MSSVRHETVEKKPYIRYKASVDNFRTITPTVNLHMKSTSILRKSVTKLIEKLNPNNIGHVRVDAIISCRRHLFYYRSISFLPVQISLEPVSCTKLSPGRRVFYVQIRVSTKFSPSDIKTSRDQLHVLPISSESMETHPL